MLKNNNILVTGGAGFIGSHLVTKLAQDNNVTIFDIFTTGREQNIAHLKDATNVKVLRVDVRDNKAVDANMENIDYVFHLAAVTSVPESIAKPLDATETNITGTMNILLAARDHSVKKVIFPSSAMVYGDEPTLPKIESMPTVPISTNGVCKIAGEQFCKISNELYNLPTVVLRFFNVFGSRQGPNPKYDALVPKIIKTIIDDNTPILFGDGEQTRDLIYVDDIIDACIKAAEVENVAGEIINIATGVPISINQITKKIIEISNKNLKPEYRPDRPGDIKHSYADITKAKKLLNWEPKIDLQTGLKETYDYYYNE